MTINFFNSFIVIKLCYLFPSLLTVCLINLFFRGHGTFMEGGQHHASVAGVVQRVNKLICVKPLKTR